MLARSSHGSGPGGGLIGDVAGLEAGGGERPAGVAGIALERHTIHLLHRERGVLEVDRDRIATAIPVVPDVHIVERICQVVGDRVELALEVGRLLAGHRDHEDELQTPVTLLVLLEVHLLEHVPTPLEARDDALEAGTGHATLTEVPLVERLAGVVDAFTALNAAGVDHLDGARRLLLAVGAVVEEPHFAVVGRATHQLPEQGTGLAIIAEVRSEHDDPGGASEIDGLSGRDGIVGRKTKRVVGRHRWTPSVCLAFARSFCLMVQVAFIPLDSIYCTRFFTVCQPVVYIFSQILRLLAKVSQMERDEPASRPFVVAR